MCGGDGGGGGGVSEGVGGDWRVGYIIFEVLDLDSGTK